MKRAALTFKQGLRQPAADHLPLTYDGSSILGNMETSNDEIARLDMAARAEGGEPNNACSQCIDARQP